MNYFRNSSEQENTVDLLIYGDIGWEITAKDVAKEVAELPENTELIRARVNTAGGGVIEGLGIYSILRNSKYEVHTYNDGVAASMGGVILMAGDERYAADYSKMLIHPVSGGDERSKRAMQDSLADILSNRSGLKRKEIDEMMSDETWLNAKESKKKGFIHNVVKSESNYELNSSLVDQMVNSIGRQNNTGINTNTNKMENIKNTLKLDSKVSEDVVNETVKDILNKVEVLEGEKLQLQNDFKDSELVNEQLKETNTKLQNEVNVHQNEKEEANKAKVEELFNKAVELGKLNKDSKEDILNEFGSNVERMEKLINSISIPVADDISNQINNNADDKKATYEGKSYAEIMVEDNAAETFKKIETEKPKLWNKMCEEHFKSDNE